MKVTIPTYVERQKTPSGSIHCVRPLFIANLEHRSELVERALDKLQRTVQKLLGDLGREPRHDSLASCTFYPTLEDAIVKVPVELRRSIARCRFLVVNFSALDRRIVFTPSFPDVWFEVPAGPSWKECAIERLQEHVLKLAKEHDDDKDWDPEELGIEKSAWITELEIEISASQNLREDDSIPFAMLEEENVGTGAQELHRVGRCLDALYPEELERAVLRDDAVDELEQLLRAADRRPVLLVGPQKVGKTTVVHECVFRRVRRRRRRETREQTWLLAPQRLISGMSYVGQWEKRVMVILEEAGKRDHILYFDDLLGLFHAGRSAQSDLSVAHLLKPAVARREFRMLAEITPEALRVLRERDRGFADLFHIVPVNEPTETVTRHMLIHVTRELESRNRCQFHIDVLPLVMDLCRRFVRDLAFPGKASAILRQLAVKHRGNLIHRGHALTDFRAKSGLAIEFLDSSFSVRRTDIVRALQGKSPEHREIRGRGRLRLAEDKSQEPVTGQEEALQVAADAICLARARLHDPERPLGSFLFLGPTGVGKTHCAKSIASYLFGNATRLLRFDMNQYVSPYAVAELVGTFHEPEGLLTTAVRRQPFAVVLFDEIEKAHPDVHDVLLQVLGEGRLTDALGRTASFANTIVILTSNLGTREAGSRLGFHDLERDDPEVYRRAAEEFFRPEFFNRLDRIVPFHRLRREHIQQIASRLVKQVFGREGLQRRRIILDVDPGALERVVDEGYHPELGARALKRSIERQMTRAVARRLAAVNLSGASAVCVWPAPDGVRVDVQRLQPAERAEGVCLDSRAVGPPEEVIPRITAALEDMLTRERERLGVTSFHAGEHRPEEEIYLTFREEVEQLRELIRDLSENIKRREDYHEAERLSLMVPPTQPRLMKRYQEHPRQAWKDAFAANDIQEFWRGVDRHSAPHARDEDAAFLRVLRRTARVWLINKPRGRVLFCLRAVGQMRPTHLEYLLRDYQRAFSEGWAAQAVEVELPEPVAEPRDIGLLVVEGPGVEVLTRIEEGTQLFLRSEASAALQVLVFPLCEEEDPLAVYSREKKRRDEWIAEHCRAPDRAQLDEQGSTQDPWRLRRVLRVWGDGLKVLDFRTGLTGSHTSNLPLMSAMLPLPPEIVTPKSHHLED